MPISNLDLSKLNDVQIFADFIILNVSTSHPFKENSKIRISEFYFSNIGIFIDFHGLEFQQPPSDDCFLLSANAKINGNPAIIYFHFNKSVPNQIEIIFQGGQILSDGWNRKIDEISMETNFD